MHFMPNQLMTDDRLTEGNACGSVGFNCVVTADGRIQALQLNGDSPELRITSDRIEGASLFIAPDSDTDLISSSGRGFHLPVKVCVFFLRLVVARRSAESSSMSWAPQKMESFTI